jgi:hypothetical protein
LAEQVVASVLGAVRIGVRQVDLVQDGHDFHAEVQRRVAVGDGLRFHALRRVDDEQRALAGGQRTRHFIAEVDVARGVDQVQVIDLAIARLVGQRRGLGLDGDAALALQVHRVEHLLVHFTFRQAAAQLDDAVRQGRFTVIDVGDDGKVTYVFH